MRPVLMKAYAALHPADQRALRAIRAVLEDWRVAAAVELEGDLLRVSFEGDYFPGEDVARALEPLLTPESRGKLDVMDLEAWILHRFFFDHGRVSSRRASLNQALESCASGGWGE